MNREPIEVTALERIFLRSRAKKLEFARAQLIGLAGYTGSGTALTLVDIVTTARETVKELEAEYNFRTKELYARIQEIREEFAGLLDLGEEIEAEARRRIREDRSLNDEPLRGVYGELAWRKTQELSISDETSIPSKFMKADEKRLKSALLAGLEIKGAALEEKRIPVISTRKPS